MALDGNPQAVFHGAGFAQLEELAAPSYNISNNNFRSAGANTWHIADNTEPGMVLGINVSGGTAGTKDSSPVVHQPTQFINVDDIPEAAAATTQAGSAARGLPVTFSIGFTIYLARSSGGNLLVASAANNTFGGAGFVVHISKVK